MNSIGDNFDFRCLQQEAFRHIDIFVNSFYSIRNVECDLLYGKPEVEEIEISVIIPTFQRRSLFKETLMSVIRQEDAKVKWECLVVDNTPLDDSNSTPALEILREIGDTRICYYHNRVNIGPGYNWNRGVELAKGKWVCFLHDDDVLFSDALKNIAQLIRRQSKGRIPLGIIKARRVAFTHDSELEKMQARSMFYIEPLTRTRALIRGDTGMGAPSCGTTFLKQAYVECGGINYDFGLNADAILAYQIMKRYRVICSDTVLGGYRWAENETLKKSTLQKLIQADYLFACYRYNQTPFSRLWGRLFWRAEYNENIRYKIRDGKKGNIILAPKDFNEILPYRRTNLLIFFLYKVIQRLYTFFSIILYPLTYRTV